MKRHLLFLIPFFLPLEISAGEVSLGEILVSPPSRGPELPDTILPSTVIDRETLSTKRTSLPEILSETAGLQIKRLGGLDDFATVSLRGSTSEQVAIYLDGLLLNSAVGGGVNLASIPSHQIERVEIYRGAVPSLYASSGIGGAIVITTRRPENKETEIVGSYGSYNSWEGGVRQSGKLFESGYKADYQFAHSDGNFRFEDDNGTPFNPDDDQTTTRINNEFNRHSLIAHWTRPLPGEAKVQIQEQIFREDRGIPGLGSLTSEVAHLSTTRTLTRFEIVKNRFSVAPFFSYQKQQFSDRQGEIGLGRQETDDDTLRYGVEGHHQWLAGSHQKILLTTSFTGEQFLPQDFESTEAVPKSVRNQGSVGLEDEISLADEKILLNPSVRVEFVKSDFPDASPAEFPVSGKIGGLWRASSLVTLKTNLARAYRLPNFSELFGDQGTLIGNSALVTEQGWNWDAGFELKKDRLSWESHYFMNRVSDLIQFISTSQFTARAENLRSATIQGVETSLAIPITEWFHVSGNYTYERATDTSGIPGTEGKILPGRPQHTASGRAVVSYRRLSLHQDLTTLDGNFLDSQNLLRVNHRLFYSAGLTLRPHKKIMIGLDAKNLLNDRVVDIVGFPLPGRSYYGRFQITI